MRSHAGAWERGGNEGRGNEGGTRGVGTRGKMSTLRSTIITINEVIATVDDI